MLGIRYGSWLHYRRSFYIYYRNIVGVLIAGCGTEAVRLRPATILEKCHVDIFLNTLEEVLRETK